MSIGQVCQRQVVCINRNATATQAAEMMREFHVGTLVVEDRTNGDAIPVGLITDRDIVVGVVAARIDADALIVGEIMTPQLLTVQADDDIYEVIRMMRARGVRRLPVLDGNRLVGIVSQDDLFMHLSQEMMALSTVSQRQRFKEAQARV